MYFYYLAIIIAESKGSYLRGILTTHHLLMRQLNFRKQFIRYLCGYRQEVGSCLMLHHPLCQKAVSQSPF